MGNFIYSREDVLIIPNSFHMNVQSEVQDILFKSLCFHLQVFRSFHRLH